MKGGEGFTSWSPNKKVWRLWRPLFCVCYSLSEHLVLLCGRPDFQPVNLCLHCSGCGLWIVSSLSSLVSRWQEGCVCALPAADVVQCRRPFSKLSPPPPSLPPFTPFPFSFFFFFETWNLEDTVEWGKGSNSTHTHTRPHKHEWPTWHTDTNCAQENFWQLYVAADMFRGFNLSTAEELSSSGRLQRQQEMSPPTAGSYRRGSSIHAYTCTSTPLYKLLRTHWLK